MRRMDIMAIVVFFLNLTFIGCKPDGIHADKKFHIISEISSDKSSPFYIDFQSYPSCRDTLPIGVFDSGTGGLEVLNSILEMDQFNNDTHQPGSDGIPDFVNERFIYLGDKANMPYGKYDEEGKADFLRELVLKDVRFMLGKEYFKLPSDTVPQRDKEQVKAIIIACNTATAYGLEIVREALKIWKLNIPVFGIIEAGSRSSVELLNAGDAGKGIIGVLATEGTCSSLGYPKAIEKNVELKYPGSTVNVAQQPGIGLAGAIDGDMNYLDPSATKVRSREEYKGPQINDPLFPIDTANWKAYNFDDEGNSLLIEKNSKGEIINVQLNSVPNYTRYAVTQLVLNIHREYPGEKLTSVILGCTHYPFVLKNMHAHLQFLKHLDQKFNQAIAEEVSFIDPAQSMSEEVYEYMAENNLWAKSANNKSKFFISVPNPVYPGNQLDQKGEFTYLYKYGRDYNTSAQFVKIVPFSDQWIDETIKKRIKEAIPTTFNIIY
jgi:glutamate racemase